MAGADVGGSQGWHQAPLEYDCPKTTIVGVYLVNVHFLLEDYVFLSKTNILLWLDICQIIEMFS